MWPRFKVSLNELWLLSFKSESKCTYQLWLTPFSLSFLGVFLLLCYLSAEAVFLFGVQQLKSR